MRCWLQKGFPCIRISVSEDVILEQVYHLQFLENTAQKNRGQSASVQIYFDYSFDQETDLTPANGRKFIIRMRCAN